MESVLLSRAQRKFVAGHSLSVLLIHSFIHSLPYKPEEPASFPLTKRTGACPHSCIFISPVFMNMVIYMYYF